MACGLTSGTTLRTGLISKESVNFTAQAKETEGSRTYLTRTAQLGWAPHPLKLSAYDIANDEIVKDEDGYCIEQPSGEPGLLLIEITGKSEFEGYTNKDASSQKGDKERFH